MMYCSNCGTKIVQGTGNCNQCGHKIPKQRGKLTLFWAVLLTLFFVGISLIGFQSLQESIKHVDGHTLTTRSVTGKQMISASVAPVPVKVEMATPPKSVSEIIVLAQPKVFTIFTTYRQGSGFLINNNGHILTNAHVIEGELYPMIRGFDGNEYGGEVIGYSNTTDIAVIHVPALEGKESLQFEEVANVVIGDEVIALGSPKGYENTATLGNISGVERTFIIHPFEYKNVYQTSAPIAPGSSGGPLLSKETGKVLAINSARDFSEMNIGFSIPIHQVLPVINQWIQSPMSDDEIYVLFYYDDNVLYFSDYLNSFGYFDEAGYFSDSYYEYWEWDDWYYDDEYWEWEDEYYDDEYWEWEDEYYDVEYWEWEDEYYEDEYWEWEDEYYDDEYWEWEDEYYEDEYEEWDDASYDDE